MISRMKELIALNPVLLTKEEQDALIKAKNAPKITAEQEKQLKELEAKLKTQQWLGGAMPSQADRAALTACSNIMKAITANLFPNTYNWLALVSKFSEAKQKSWPAAEAEAEDECDDLFASDEDDEASFDALCKAKQAAIDKANSKKKPIAKSIITWEVKPLESETNLDELAKRIMKIE